MIASATLEPPAGAEILVLAPLSLDGLGGANVRQRTVATENVQFKPPTQVRRERE